MGPYRLACPRALKIVEPALERRSLGLPGPGGGVGLAFEQRRVNFHYIRVAR